jgi:hypothetical protein
MEETRGCDDPFGSFDESVCGDINDSSVYGGNNRPLGTLSIFCKDIQHLLMYSLMAPIGCGRSSGGCSCSICMTDAKTIGMCRDARRINNRRRYFTHSTLRNGWHHPDSILALWLIRFSLVSRAARKLVREYRLSIGHAGAMRIEQTVRIRDNHNYECDRIYSWTLKHSVPIANIIDSVLRMMLQGSGGLCDKIEVLTYPIDKKFTYSDVQGKPLVYSFADLFAFTRKKYKKNPISQLINSINGRRAFYPKWMVHWETRPAPSCKHSVEGVGSSSVGSSICKAAKCKMLVWYMCHEE